MKFFYLIICTLFLSGCVTQSTKNDVERNDVTQALDNLKRATQLGFSPFDLYDPSGNNPGLTTKNGFNAYQRWFCSKDDNAHYSGQRYISKYCDNLGGHYKGTWCHNSDYTAPLFYANIGDGWIADKSVRASDCAAGRMVGILAITNENFPNSTEWQTFARGSLQYVTPQEEEHHKKEQARKTKEKEKLIAENRKKEAKNILSQGIGTKICSVQGRLTNVGYVEKIVNGKIKITLSEAFLTRAPNISPSGFVPKVIWDQPENWFICN